jgi:hypothetical protein
MEIRIRETGQTMTESEFRRLHNQTSFPPQLSVELLDSFGADVVMEGPQASPLEFWQYSMRSGIEQINGKWYTKYIAGPVFVDNEEATAAEQQAAYIAQKAAERIASLQESIVTATQQRLDSFASSRNYDGILSLCTYATDPNPTFQGEGQYGVEARSATWAKLYDILAEVEAGTRPMPTGYEDIESELPALTWPE